MVWELVDGEAEWLPDDNEWELALMEPTKERIQYLKFIRDTVFGSNAQLEVVKCRKYPEFGQILRDDIVDLISMLENCKCRGEGCTNCIPSLGLDKEVEDMASTIIDGRIVGKPLTGRYVKGREDNMDTMDPEFYDRQAAEMLRRAEILRSIPQSDAFEDGQVLLFSKTFISQGTAPTRSEYHYAAIKANGLWHVTGDKAPSNIFWGALMQFIGINNLSTLKVLDMEKSVPIAEYVAKVTKALEEVK